jgi:5'-phosphate synthase pdxT subunit
MRIGVLALQGGFAEHIAALLKLGVAGLEIRKPSDLDGGIDGLIIPGGESTVIGRLLRETGLFALLKARIDGGLPVFGTCAGMILLAKKIENEPAAHFAAIGITVKRNAFGRQLGSFRTTGAFRGIGEIPMTFIRAPYIESADDTVRILASVDGIKVAAESGNILVTAFHPELTDDLRVLSYFLEKKVKPNLGSQDKRAPA